MTWIVVLRGTFIIIIRIYNSNVKNGDGYETQMMERGFNFLSNKIKKWNKRVINIKFLCKTYIMTLLRKCQNIKNV